MARVGGPLSVRTRVRLTNGSHRFPDVYKGSKGTIHEVSRYPEVADFVLVKWDAHQNYDESFWVLSTDVEALSVLDVIAEKLERANTFAEPS